MFEIIPWKVYCGFSSLLQIQHKFGRKCWTQIIKNLRFWENPLKFFYLCLICTGSDGSIAKINKRHDENPDVLYKKLVKFPQAGNLELVVTQQFCGSKFFPITFKVNWCGQESGQGSTRLNCSRFVRRIVQAEYSVDNVCTFKRALCF